MSPSLPAAPPLDGTLTDGSLITCGEGVEDILIYLMELSSPLSDLCKKFDPHSRISEETPQSIS